MCRRLYSRPIKNLKRIIRFFYNSVNGNSSQAPSNQEMTTYLRSLGLNTTERLSGGISSQTCPLCPKPHNNDRTNFWTLNFKENSGLFMCFRCGSSGNWNQFKRKMNTESKELSTRTPNQSRIHTSHSSNFRANSRDFDNSMSQEREYMHSSAQRGKTHRRVQFNTLRLQDQSRPDPSNADDVDAGIDRFS